MSDIQLSSGDSVSGVADPTIPFQSVNDHDGARTDPTVGCDTLDCSNYFCFPYLL